MATEPVSPITDTHTCIDGACPGCLAIIGRLRAALDKLDADMHRISSRPCRTCYEVTKAVGKPFGCAKRDRG